MVLEPSPILIVSQFVFEDAFEGDCKFKPGVVFGDVKADLSKTLQLTGKIENEKYLVSVDNKEGGLTEANFKLLLAFL